MRDISHLCQTHAVYGIEGKHIYTHRPLSTSLSHTERDTCARCGVKRTWYALPRRPRGCTVVRGRAAALTFMCRFWRLGFTFRILELYGIGISRFYGFVRRRPVMRPVASAVSNIVQTSNVQKPIRRKQGHFPATWQSESLSKYFTHCPLRCYSMN